MSIAVNVARLLKPGQLVFEEERLDPAALLPGEVFAKTLYSAISVGTEMAAFLGAPPLRPSTTYPRLVGYCNVAQIEAVGAAVQAYRAGDRVLSFESHRSAFVCAADKLVLRVPEGADLQLATTTYLFHLGHNALLKGGFVPAHQVAVVGLGTLGMATVALAASLGAQVSAYSDQPPALALARELGAGRALPKAQPGAIPAADLVITTSNLWEDWRLALQLARRDGAICVLGFPGRGQPLPQFNPLDSQYFYDKQLRLIACGDSPDAELKRDCQLLLDRIVAGRLPARRLIDGVHPWHRLAEVYAGLAKRRSGELARILDWQAQ